MFMFNWNSEILYWAIQLGYMVVNKVKTNFLVFVGELDHLGTNII